MQLGTRWPVGDEPPSRLPPKVVDAIRVMEAELSGIDTSQWRWTLTWLEGNPIVELDDGSVIRYDRSTDTVSVTIDTDNN